MVLQLQLRRIYRQLGGHRQERKRRRLGDRANSQPRSLSQQPHRALKQAHNPQSRAHTLDLHPTAKLSTSAEHSRRRPPWPPPGNRPDPRRRSSIAPRRKSGQPRSNHHLVWPQLRHSRRRRQRRRSARRRPRRRVPLGKWRQGRGVWPAQGRCTVASQFSAAQTGAAVSVRDRQTRPTGAPDQACDGEQRKSTLGIQESHAPKRPVSGRRPVRNLPERGPVCACRST